MNNKKKSIEEVLMTLPVQAYDLKAIMNAAYDMTDKAVITVNEISADKYVISIVSIDLRPNNNTIKNEYLSRVLDHQVRIMVDRDTILIKQLILAQAFDPCENLDELLKSIGQGDKSGRV